MYCMENSEIIISKSLEASQVSTLHVELGNLLKKLEPKTFEDFLNGESDKEVRNIDNEIRQIVSKAIYSQAKSEDDKIAEVAQLIFTEKSYLIKGTMDADVKSILIFLCMNCHLKIDIENLLTKQEISENFTQPVSDKILTLLQSIKTETKAQPNAPFYEKEMLVNFEIDFLNNDIKRTYHFIEALERGSRGFHFNFLLENLIVFLNQININCFSKVLYSLNNPQMFVFYLQSLKKEKLLQLTDDPLLVNKWFNFELIRQIIKKENKGKLEDIDCLAIKNALTKINSSDFDFLKQTIQYFHSSNILNASLGELLSSLPNSQINEIITDCFVIDKYENDRDARNYFLKYFRDKASENQYKFLIVMIFKKWKLFLEILSKAEDSYQNELILTDFCDFVVIHYTLFMSEEDVIIQLKNLLNKIKFIDTEWVISVSQQMTKYYIYQSELYLLSYAYQNKKLIDTEIVSLFTDMKQNEIQIQRYSRKENSSHFDIIEENFNYYLVV